jgi:hypothetical protein
MLSASVFVFTVPNCPALPISFFLGIIRLFKFTAAFGIGIKIAGGAAPQKQEHNTGSNDLKPTYSAINAQKRNLSDWVGMFS